MISCSPQPDVATATPLPSAWLCWAQHPQPNTDTWPTLPGIFRAMPPDDEALAKSPCWSTQMTPTVSCGAASSSVADSSLRLYRVCLAQALSDVRLPSAAPRDLAKRRAPSPTSRLKTHNSLQSLQVYCFDKSFLLPGRGPPEKCRLILVEHHFSGHMNRIENVLQGRHSPESNRASQLEGSH